jgi:hypothetical protein
MYNVSHLHVIQQKFIYCIFISHKSPSLSNESKIEYAFLLWVRITMSVISQVGINEHV